MTHFSTLEYQKVSMGLTCSMTPHPRTSSHLSWYRISSSHDGCVKGNVQSTQRYSMPGNDTPCVHLHAQSKLCLISLNQRKNANTNINFRFTASEELPCDSQQTLLEILFDELGGLEGVALLFLGSPDTVLEEAEMGGASGRGQKLALVQKVDTVHLMEDWVVARIDLITSTEGRFKKNS